MLARLDTNDHLHFVCQRMKDLWGILSSIWPSTTEFCPCGEHGHACYVALVTFFIDCIELHELPDEDEDEENQPAVDLDLVAVHFAELVFEISRPYLAHG